MDIRRLLLEEFSRAEQDFEAQNDDASREKKPVPDEEKIVVEEALLEAQKEAERKAQEAELEQKIKQAYDEGYQKGKLDQKADSDASLDARIAQALDEWKEKLVNCDEDIAQWKTHMQAYVEQVMCAMADSMIIRKMQEDPLGEVYAALEKIMKTIRGKTSLTLTVNPAIMDGLRSKLSGVDCEVHLEADEEIELCDCKVEWHDGAIEVSKQEIWKQIQAIMGMNSNNNEWIQPITEEDKNKESDEDDSLKKGAAI